MKFNNEMKEIIEYLNTRDSYVIFAGFAAYLQAGLDSSDDIDIFVAPEEISKIAEEFEKKGWTIAKTAERDGQMYWKKLEKNIWKS